jgi:hypothetical protein
MAAYFIDDRLSTAETTRRFPANGVGHETNEIGFYGIAIRPVGERSCLFRFAARDRAGARSMLEALNRADAAG